MARQSYTTVGLLVPLFTLLTSAIAPAAAQTRFPDETELHEGTWLVWPHHYTYGTAYRNSLDATWVAMTKALAPGEKVHIVAYNATEQTRIINLLTTAAVPLTRVDFVVRQSDDVWVRDNGPMFVFDSAGSMKATDWGFDGWGDDTPFTKDETVPVGVCSALNVPRVDIGGIVLEGGALEHDGHGTMMACRSSILESKRNPGVTQAQLEAALLTHFGFTKFIWLDGAFGGTDDITDMHIDGFMRFAPGRRLVTMSNTDLTYWGLSSADITRVNQATDASGAAYTLVRLPLTAADVKTTSGTNLGYKGSYANYYVGNTSVLVPAYNDTNDAVARAIIAPLYPGRTVVGIDVRNLYENGGMVHCVTQQQPAVPLRTTLGAASATALTIQFQGDPRHTYRLQASSNMLSNSWTDVETFTLNGQYRTLSGPKAGLSRRFFRVVEP